MKSCFSLQIKTYINALAHVKQEKQSISKCLRSFQDFVFVNRYCFISRICISEHTFSMKNRRCWSRGHDAGVCESRAVPRASAATTSRGAAARRDTSTTTTAATDATTTADDVNVSTTKFFV